MPRAGHGKKLLQEAADKIILRGKGLEMSADRREQIPRQPMHHQEKQTRIF